MGNDGTLNFDTKIDSSGFQKGLNGMGSVAKAGIGLTTKVLKGATVGLTALGGAAIKVGSDFEAGMSQVQAISGASGEDLEKLKNKAKEMGATTKFSATESAEALNYMAMAGWKTEDMLGGLEGVMNLAAASGEDLATSSDIVTDAMTALGMQASEAGHFSDVLAAAASNANTTVGGMGETFKYAGAMAGTLGYSVEDVALATGLMANAGIKGTMAGTSLNSIMTRLSTNTNGARDAIEELGVSFFNSDGSARSLTDVMSELREATKDMTTEQKANFANTVAGMEAQKGLSAILNATEDDYNKLSEAIQNADGCAQEMAETMQDNLQGQLTILQSGLEGLGISLYETFQGTAKDVVKEAQGMVQQLQDAFNAGGFEGLVSAVGDVLAQIVQRLAEAAPELINMAVSLVGSFCDGLKSAPGIGEAGASLIISIITGISSCVGDLWSTAIVLVGKMADGLAAGAPQLVQAISTAITDMLECLVDWGPDLIQAGIDILLALIQGIANTIPTLITQAITLITDFCNILVQNLPAIIDAGLQLVQGLIQGLVNGLPLLLQGAITLFMSILEALPVVIDQLLSALPTLITTIIDFFTQNIPLIVQGAITLLNGIIEAIPTIVQSIVDNLPQIIMSLVNGLTTALPQIVQAAITLLMGIIQAIPDIVVTIAENLPQIITSIASGLAQAIPQIFTAAKDLLWQLILAVPDIVVGIGQAIPDIISGIVNGLIGGIGAVWDAACELGSGILDGIKSFFGINSPSTVMAEQGDYLVQGLINGLAAMPDQMMATLNTALNNLIAWGQQMLSGIQNTVQNMVNSAEQVISQLPGKIWTWLVNVVTKVTAWGQQMLNTARTAIQNMISSVVQLISELPGKIWTHLVNVVTKVTAWGQQMLTAATTAIQNMISKIISLISQLPGKVWTHLVNVVTKVTTWGQQMLSAATTAIQNMVSRIISKLAELPGKVTSKLAEVTAGMVQWGSDIVSKMTSVGSNIVTGIWNGISSGWDWLKGKVSDLANSLLDSAKSALGINSPSTAFRDDFGRWLMPGAMQGVKKSMPQTLKDMKAEAGKLIAAMQGTVDASMSNFSLTAAGTAGLKAVTSAGTIVEIDNSQKQENNYHVAVPSPSEVAKNQREAFRNFQKGVK